MQSVRDQSSRPIFSTTGGAYDTVPEVNLLLALFNTSDKYVPILFDEAGEYFSSCA